MYRYKVGDRVIIINKGYSCYGNIKGFIGTILKLELGDYGIKLDKYYEKSDIYGHICEKGYRVWADEKGVSKLPNINKFYKMLDK